MPEEDHGRDREITSVELTLVALLLLSMAWAALGANPFRDEIVAPMDLMLSARAWSSQLETAPEVLDHDKSDILDAWLPRWIYVKERLLDFELPLWNPYMAGGQPALPLLQDSYISPSFLFFLLFEDGLGFTLGLLARLWIAGIGTYLLCRLSFGIAPSLLGAVTFMLCGFNLSWLMWPQVATSCWIPWVLWALLRLLQKISARRVAVLSVAVALMLFGGFPAVAGYTLYLAALLAIWVSLTVRKVPITRAGAAVAGAVSLGFLLTSLQMLPIIEYLSQVDLSWRQAGWLPFDKIVFLLLPFYKGYEPHPEIIGYVGWTAMLLAPFALLQRRWRGAFSGFFWASICLLSLMLIYGQPWPLVELVFKLPVFNMNPNGRLLSIFGISMALLAAIGSDYLERHLSRERIAATLALLLLLPVQMLDLSRISRSQNAVVSDDWFFPEHPVIKKLQTRLQPGESVLDTSDAFRFPGLMVAYGMQDWFAHTHRLPGERELLACLVEDPWVTNTAALIDFEDVRFDHPCMDLFSVRFILTRRPTLAAHRLGEVPRNVEPGDSTRQSFRLEKRSQVRGLQLLTATGGVTALAESARVNLLDDRRNRIASVSAEHPIADNGWTEFDLPEPIEMGPGLYYLQFEVTGAAPEGGLYLWTDKGELPQTVAYRILGIPIDRAENWNVSRQHDVTIFENRDLVPGAFFSSSLDPETADRIHWEGIRLSEASPESLSWFLDVRQSDWFVFSARRWPGWKAYIDGRKTETSVFHDLMPAVPIEAGRHRVEWIYEPESWNRGLLLSLLGLAILVALLIIRDRHGFQPEVFEDQGS